MECINLFLSFYCAYYYVSYYCVTYHCGVCPIAPTVLLVTLRVLLLCAFSYILVEVHFLFNFILDSLDTMKYQASYYSTETYNDNLLDVRHGSTSNDLTSNSTYKYKPI